MALAVAPSADWSLPASQGCERSTEETCSQRDAKTGPRREWTWCASCRRNAAVRRVGSWLRHRHSPDVLSLTCYDEGGGGGAPDRRWDSVAVESDLRQAMARLPLLERSAAEISKELDRSLQADYLAGRHGWKAQFESHMCRTNGNDWLAYVYAWNNRPAPRDEEGRYIDKRSPREALIDRAADLMVSLLGEGFY